MPRRWLILGFLLLLAAGYINAQSDVEAYRIEEKKLYEAEMLRYKTLSPLSQQSLSSKWFDVTYYKLDLTVMIHSNSLFGNAVIEGVANGGRDSFLMLDLMNTMIIESLTVNDTASAFEQFPAAFRIDLNHPAETGEKLIVKIRYSGVPVPTGFGSFIFNSHSGTPWVWSLSEPYGARDWFPCNNHPSDKADSADINITVDSSYSVASNGKLTAILDNGDGTRTHYWQERYPIASYLISVAMTNFVTYSHWFHYSSTDSMEVVNYVLPEHYAQAETSLIKTVKMLEVFSGIFGLYPFIKEKYGHADFGFGGAMEHQTITSTTTYQQGVLAHELAHQWFGDMITCRTWQHLWLNEGFAQYSTPLYMQSVYGDSMYWLYINADLYRAKMGVGSVFIRDTSTVQKLFDPKLVYSKGSAVLHMLRHVLGDTLFFRSLYNYASSPALRYSTASTEDFQNVCETTSGISLEYFFKQWIYGEGYPQYRYWWKISDSTYGYTIQLGVEQELETSNPSYFTMPVDIVFKNAGWDTTITLFNSQATQYYEVRLPFRPDSIKLDPEGWILKEATEISPDGQPFPIPFQFSLNQNYPNPFNGGTILSFSIKEMSFTSVKVYSLLGSEIATIINESLPPGDYTHLWEASGLPGGIYFCRIVSAGKTLVKPMVLIR